MKCPKCGHWSLFEFIYCKKCGLNLMRPNDNAETHSEEVSSSFSKKNIVITDYSNTTNELAKIGKTAQTVKAFKWEKRQPNPKSKNVEISTDGVEFSCPTCGKSNYCNYDNINSESGVMIECNHCNNISHVPGDYKSKNKLSELSIYGCVLLSIDDFSEWYWSHPCICNSSYGPEYGLFVLIANISTQVLFYHHFHLASKQKDLFSMQTLRNLLTILMV